MSTAAARRVEAHPRARAAPPAADGSYAGLVTRAVAFAIDGAVIDGVALVVGVLVALIVSVLPESVDRDAVLLAIGGAAFGVWAATYFVVFWSTTGQTPGNRVMRIVVHGADGRLLRPRRALIRLAGIVLAALPLGLGFAPILFTPHRRGLHDWLAGSVVRLSGAGNAAAGRATQRT